MNALVKKTIVAILLGCLFIIGGCSSKEPVYEEKTDASNQTQEEQEQEAKAPPLRKPETTILQGRNYQRQMLEDYVGEIEGGLIELRDDSYNRVGYFPYGTDLNLDLILNAYIYMPESNLAYVEYKIENNTDTWLYSMHRLHSTDLKTVLKTVEGQLGQSDNRNYPEYIIPPDSYVYFYHIIENVNDPVEEISFDFGNESFSFSTQDVILNDKVAFSVESKIEPDYDFSEFFSNITNLGLENWNMEAYSHMNYAKITKAEWYPDHGVITMDVIPDKYVSIFALQNHSIFFQILTDAGEMIPAKPINISGNVVDDQYPSKEPITILLETDRQISDECTAFQIHMIWAVPSGERMIYSKDGTQEIKYRNNMQDVTFTTEMISLVKNVSE